MMLRPDCRRQHFVELHGEIKLLLMWKVHSLHYIVIGMSQRNLWSQRTFSSFVICLKEANYRLPE